MERLEKISQDKLAELLKQAKQLADTVRLIKPSNTQLLNYDGQKFVKDEPGSCYEWWNKFNRCENCAGAAACAEGKRVSTIEFREQEAYSVTAVPFLLQNDLTNELVVMEMISRIRLQKQEAENGNDADSIIRNLRRDIYVDSLTKLMNRRYCEEGIGLEDMAEGTPEQIGFILIDVKEFRRVNQTYGHIVGDVLLKMVAETLKNNVRGSDVVARIGGDEYVLLLRDCSEGSVQQKAEILKSQVKKIRLKEIEDYRPEISVGTAYTDHYDGSSRAFRELFRQADGKMRAE